MRVVGCCAFDREAGGFREVDEVGREGERCWVGMEEREVVISLRESFEAEGEVVWVREDEEWVGLGMIWC